MSKVGYVRVSTMDQHLENQRRILTEAGIPRDLIFEDLGISGTMPPRKRPGFKAMLDYTQHHPEVNYLVVFELSRLGRTLIETLTMINSLEEQGIMVWSLSPNESFTRSEDRSIRQLLVAIIAWVAQRERENLMERTRAGLDRARAEGKTLGRPRHEIDWSHVHDLRANGFSWAQVADALNLTVMTLYRRRKASGQV
jgi:DNA invertase Pin-like site-specific DNA recombinase